MVMRAQSGKWVKGKGVLSLLTTITSLPISSRAKARARAVDKESPSGRRWEVMASRRQSAILRTIGSRGGTLILLARSKQPFDPVVQVRARIEGEK